MARPGLVPTLESGYFYDAEGRHPLFVEAGAHGFQPQFVAVEATILRDGSPIQPGDKTSPLPIDDTPETPHCVAARAPEAAAPVCTLNRFPYIEFIVFGKSHRYYADAFCELAPTFHRLLRDELRILAQSLVGSMRIAYEILDGDGSLGCYLSKGIDWVKRVFASTEDVRPEEYDALLDRAYRAIEPVDGGGGLDYVAMHRCGLELMRVRWEQQRLDHKVHRRLESLIESAELGLKSATLAEDVSFSVLDLYGQVRFLKNPAGLAAYRLGVLALRAGAHATGEAIAGSDARQIWRAVADQARSGFPPIAIGLVQGTFRKALKGRSFAMPEKIAEELIGLTLFSLFEVIDFQIFEAPSVQPPGAARRQFLDKFLPRLAKEMVVSAAQLVVEAKTRGLAPDAARRFWIERIGTVCSSLVQSCFAELETAKATADKENRSISAVLLSDLGWIIVRLLKSVAFALGSKKVLDDADDLRGKGDEAVAAALQKEMKAELERGAASDTPPAPSPAQPPGPSRNGTPTADPADAAVRTGLARDPEIPAADKTALPKTTRTEAPRRKSVREVKITKSRKRRSDPARAKVSRRRIGRKPPTEAEVAARKDSDYQERVAGAFVEQEGYALLARSDPEARRILGISQNAGALADILARKEGKMAPKFVVGEAKGTGLDRALEQLRATLPPLRRRFGQGIEFELFIFIRPGSDPVLDEARTIRNGRIFNADGSPLLVEGRHVNVVELFVVD